MLFNAYFLKISVALLRTDPVNRRYMVLYELTMCLVLCIGRRGPPAGRTGRGRVPVAALHAILFVCLCLCVRTGASRDTLLARESGRRAGYRERERERPRWSVYISPAPVVTADVTRV